MAYWQRIRCTLQLLRVVFKVFGLICDVDTSLVLDPNHICGVRVKEVFEGLELYRHSC
jgi:hypothetical protein